MWATSRTRLAAATRCCSRPQLCRRRPFQTRLLSSRIHDHSSGLGGILKISDEVRDALESNRPVVALESTIYTHGAVARSELGLEDIVRQNGGTPAVIGVLAGVPTVGLTDAEVERMISEGANKVSRRDLAYLAGLVGAPPRPT